MRVTAHIAKVLYKRFGSIFGGADDFEQQVAVWTLESLPRFDPAVGTLDAYAYRNARNRAMNALRDRVTRRDYPCERCHSGEPCGPDGAFCPDYYRWFRRNRAKANLARPLGLDHVADHTTACTVEDEVAGRELAQRIDRHLPVELRADYLRMLAGTRPAVPLQRRKRVQQAVADIMAGNIGGDEPVAAPTLEELGLEEREDEEPDDEEELVGDD